MNNILPFNRESEYRLPPANIDAERALLGAILLNNKTIDQVIDFVKPEFFTDPAAARVYETILKLIEHGHQANPLTLKTHMEADEIVSQAGGFQYLLGLGARMVTTINVRDYGLLLTDLYLRREMIHTGQDMISAAYDCKIEEPADSILETTEERLFSIGSMTERQDTLSTIENAGHSAIDLAHISHKRNGQISGLTTGLRDLDKQMGGFHPSDLIILAGRPSMGKTALATTIAFNAAKYFRDTSRPEHQGKQVVFFSLEMTAPQLATRILAHLSNNDSHKIRTGGLSNDQFTNLVQAAPEFADLPLLIDDKGTTTVNSVRTRARRLARKKGSKGIGLIVIDYLQLMAPPSDTKDQGRVLQLGAMTRGLKALAKDLNVPVLVLSQLSRAVEQRDDKRPQLSDLRESGTIEQDADVVIFAYREAYYLERQEPREGHDSEDVFHKKLLKWRERMASSLNVAEAIIGKQRHGPIATVPLHFNGPTTWFSDLAHEYRPIQGME